MRGLPTWVALPDLTECWRRALQELWIFSFEKTMLPSDTGSEDLCFEVSSDEERGSERGSKEGREAYERERMVCKKHCGVCWCVQRGGDVAGGWTW